MSVRSRVSARAGRPAMRSPGRPPVGRREHRQRFWEAIARGVSSEEAAAAAGVSAARRPVVPRGWRDAIGQPASDVGPLLVVR
jgi:transposase, IS30 family